MPNTRAALVYGVHAIASVLGAGGGGTYDRQRGFTGNAGITRNGAGDYTLTLSDAIDTTPAQHVLFGSTADGAAAAIDSVIAYHHSLPHVSRRAGRHGHAVLRDGVGLGSQLARLYIPLLMVSNGR